MNKLLTFSLLTVLVCSCTAQPKTLLPECKTYATDDKVTLYRRGSLEPSTHCDEYYPYTK